LTQHVTILPAHSISRPTEKYSTTQEFPSCYIEYKGSSLWPQKPTIRTCSAPLQWSSQSCNVFTLIS